MNPLSFGVADRRTAADPTPVFLQRSHSARLCRGSLIDREIDWPIHGIDNPGD
jgi:hypothetical protein